MPTAEQLADRMQTLLTEAGKDRGREMKAVLRLLDEAGIEVGDVSQESPEEFSRELFLETGWDRPRLVQLGENLDPYNLRGAESPEDLILRMIPSDGHLE